MLVIVPLSGGCATIFSGTSEDITFRSDPENAQVYLNGALRGTTPLTLSLKRKGNYVVSMTLAGYQTQTDHLRKGIAPWFFGNILIGGLVGVFVDIFSGAITDLEPDEFSMTLVPLRRGETAGPPSTDRLTPEEELAQLEQLYAHGSVAEKDYLARKKKLDRKIERNSKKQNR